jgi:anthranilate phosphoribosyltransferase
MRRFIKEVGRGKDGARDLTHDEALEAARLMMEGVSSEAQTAALLMAIRVKGEAPLEILAFAEALHEKSRRIPVAQEQLSSLVDCAGPHDGRKGYAATIPVSVLCATAGLPMLLHASPSLPPKLGCSLEDILQAAGLNPVSSASDVQEDLKRQGLSYYSAEIFCPPLARLRKLREEIGLRTLLNTAEKFINCGGARNLLLGVNHQSAVERLTSMPLMEGIEKAVIVQGLDGSEDLPVHKVSTATVLTRGKRSRHIDMDPATFGLGGDLHKDYSPAQQAELIERILAGEEHPALRSERNMVVYNTAFRLWIFGARASMNEALETALELLRSGKCLMRYLNWVRRRAEASQFQAA